MYEPGTKVYCYYQVGYYEKIRFGEVLEYSKTPEGEFYTVNLGGTPCPLPCEFVNTKISTLLESVKLHLIKDLTTRLGELYHSASDLLDEQRKTWEEEHLEDYNNAQLLCILRIINSQRQ